MGIRSRRWVGSHYTYGYDPAGRITGWEQQRGSEAAVKWTLGYDLASQLETAVKAPAAGGATITDQSWIYDKIGNRTKQTIDGAVTDYTPNSLNQLTQVSPKGPVRFEGSVNQGATVEVGGQAASLDAEHKFSADVVLQNSVQDVAVSANTPAGQAITQVYQVKRDEDQVYDLNGNLTHDGERSYTWDAANRLVKVSTLDPSTGMPLHTSEFTSRGLKHALGHAQ